jgi:hypothetical protein
MEEIERYYYFVLFPTPHETKKRKKNDEERSIFYQLSRNHNTSFISAYFGLDCECLNLRLCCSRVQKLWLVDLLMSLKVDNQTNGLRAFFEKPQDVESQPKQI